MTDTPEYDALRRIGCEGRIKSYDGGIYTGSSELHTWLAYDMDGQVQLIPILWDVVPEIAKFTVEELEDFRDRAGLKIRKGR